MQRRMLSKVKVSGYWFGCVLAIFLNIVEVFAKRSPSRLPVSPMYGFLQKVQVKQ